MILHGTKVLETERLILRPFENGDEEEMFQNYCNDERVTEYLSWKPHGTKDNTLMYLNYCLDKRKENSTGTYHWAIVYKESNHLIGSVEAIKVDEKKRAVSLGYVLGYDYWGKGIMPEAVKQVIDYLFQEEGFERISAWHDVRNPKSGKVMQKTGMKQEGILRKFELDADNHLKDVVMYAITDEDYIKNK